MLGDVPSSRRDQKVKETKVSPAPAGMGGFAGQWGRCLGDAPRGKDLSEAAQFAGASRGVFDPFGVFLQLAWSFFVNNE